MVPRVTARNLKLEEQRLRVEKKRWVFIKRQNQTKISEINELYSVERRNLVMGSAERWLLQGQRTEIDGGHNWIEADREGHQRESKQVCWSKMITLLQRKTREN